MESKAAKFMSVSDILLQQTSPYSRGVLVRTIGKLDLVDSCLRRGQLRIQDPTSTHKLPIDCSRILPLPFQDQHGFLYQFIGEVDYSQDKSVIIKALLYRCCEGLDIDTYIQASTRRMDYKIQQKLIHDTTI